MPLKAKSKKDDTASTVQEFTDFMNKVNKLLILTFFFNSVDKVIRKF